MQIGLVAVEKNCILRFSARQLECNVKQRVHFAEFNPF